MRSTADSTDLSHLQAVQGTTGGKQLAPDDLLALRAFFLLLDEWDEGATAKAKVVKSNANLPMRYISCINFKGDNL